MKIALVHDWIIGLGGAEKVLRTLHWLFPLAPVYTLFTKPEFVREFLPNATIITSKLQSIPGHTRWYPALAPVMPWAIENFDFSDFDLVISSSVIFSKGIITRPQTRHVSYCYSPTRFLWDRAHQYEGGMSWFRHGLRVWDTSAALRPDQFIAPSQTVAQRIKHYYHRESVVIPPPVDTLTDPIAPTHTPSKDFFLIVGRLYPHKNISPVIQAFGRLSIPLVIVGDGPLRSSLTRHAPANVSFVGQCSDGQLAWYYHNCQAVIIASDEDFGLTAIEAFQAGKPVLALRAGAVPEIVVEGTVGEFFDAPIPELIADGVRQIRDNRDSYQTSILKQTAQRYTGDQFASELLEVL